MHVAVCFRALLLITLFGSGSSSLEWTLQSFLGHSHNLYCDDLTTNITAPEIGHWILPSGIPAEADGRHYEIVTRFNIRGYILQVTNITREMSGVYICEIRRADGTREHEFCAVWICLDQNSTIGWTSTPIISYEVPLLQRVCWSQCCPCASFKSIAIEQRKNWLIATAPKRQQPMETKLLMTLKRNLTILILECNVRFNAILKCRAMKMH